MSGTYGRTSGKRFATYDPDTRFWRMSEVTSLWGSIPFSGTLPKTGSLQDGQLFAHQMSVPPIIGNVSSCSYLPTPKANDFRDNNSPAEARRKDPALTCVRVYFPESNGVRTLPLLGVGSG